MDKVKKEDYFLMDKPRIYLTLGRQGAGKSNYVKWLLLRNTIEHKILKKGLVFTRTKYDDEYNYIDDNYVISGYDEEKLKKYMSILEGEVKNKSAKPNFLIFDDLLGLHEMIYSPYFKNLLAIHRHSKTSILLNFQYWAGANTILREVAHVVNIFKTTGKRSLNGMYENFGFLFDNFEEFKKHFREITKEPYTSMLYLNDIVELNNNYLKFKAPDMSKVNYKLSY